MSRAESPSSVGRSSSGSSSETRSPRAPARSGRTALAVVALTVLLVAVVAVPVAASPAPVSACPPCDDGFVRAADGHGLATDVDQSRATVRVHRNGSATWTVRVVPTNDSVLARLAANDSLARAVASDSFGIRYGDGIEQELLGADVREGAFVVRYRTLDVVRDGPFGTHLVTYFRDSPGAYVYTDLGADELTVVAPDGTTVARGFGEVTGRRMTATDLPDVRDGPFVVVAPADAPAPGLLGVLAVLDALAGVIARNVLLFVLLPASVVAGGLLALRRILPAATDRDPDRFGTTVAAGGALLVAVSVATEADALPVVTGNLLLGAAVGGVAMALGTAVTSVGVRRLLTTPRLVGVALALAVSAVAAGERALGGDFHAVLAVGGSLFPAVVALGRADAVGESGDRVLAALVTGLVASLAALAPLTALGGTLFLITPILSTFGALAFVLAAVPLYLLGVASATGDAATADADAATDAA